MWRRIWSAGLAVALGGCVGTPALENPLLIRSERTVPHGNPIYIPQGPMTYAHVFKKVEDILSDYFDISYASRYDGRIETGPRIAPGIEQPWKAGSPDLYQRILAFYQTIRHRAIVQITTAEDEGYFVDVKVLKELEDLPTPTRYTAGEATYRLVPTIQRQNDVVGANFYDNNWIPIGRDPALEQLILERLARMDDCSPIQ